MKQSPRIFRAVLLFVLFSLTAVPTLAQNGDGITLAAKAGFDSFYKPQFGVPVYVNVANSGPAIEGELRINLGSATASDRLLYTSPISLPTQSDKRVVLYVNITGFVNAIAVDLYDDNGRLIQSAETNTLSSVANTELLYGVVSPEPGELEFLENVSGSRGGAAVAFLDLDDLPEVPPAWNALDVLVLNDVDTGQLSADQVAALKGWVSTGGQLVVTGGPGWQKTTSALADWLPVTISGSESVADLPALSRRTGEPFRDPGPYLVTTSSLSRGELLVHQDGLPLLAVEKSGQGSVYFLALDPKLAPLLDWDGSELLWGELANRVPALSVWEMGIQDSYAATTAVSSLPSLTLPSTVFLVLFLFAYVIIIGPVNYLILKRLNRRELAWATIPVLIVFFSGLAYIAGFQIKGNNVIINQMSIAYGPADGEQMRVQSLLGLYSPRRGRYDLTLPGSALAHPFRELPGAFSSGGSAESIRRGSDVTLEGVRVDVGGTETFIADHYQPAPAVTGRAALNLDSSDIVLEATLRNNSDILLETTSLLIGNDVIVVGDLDPGKTVTVKERIGQSSSSTGFGASGPSYGSPLINQAGLILGTSNYYDDREAFPRWQLLQAVANTPSSRHGTAVTQSSGNITLIAWSKQPQLAISLGEAAFNSTGTTLYFLELPLTQTLVSGNELSVPASLLNWQTIDTGGGVYEAAIYDLYLGGGWVEFEYQPWPEFQALQVNELAINLEASDSTQPVPQVRLWDWGQESWITLNKTAWGQLIVPEHERFIGPGNIVRLRLQDATQYGITIREVYPVLTGNLQ